MDMRWLECVGETVTRKRSVLDQMRQNPRADWTIDDIRTVCEQVGLTLYEPSRGSHYKAASPFLNGHLTIPYKRPIKPCYIKSLIAMIDAHYAAEKAKED